MIAGAGSETLSLNLREHFLKLHKMSKPGKPMDRMAPGDKECEPGPVGPSAKVYREVETFGKADKSGSSPSGIVKEVEEVTRFKGEISGGEKEIDEVTRFKGEISGGEKEIDEVTRFKGEISSGEKKIDEVTRFSSEPSGGHSPKSKAEIENVTSFRTLNAKCGTGNEMVICPLCDSEIRGMNDDELSNNLGRHLTEAHKI
jgi:phage terminase large subunit-like protein